MKEARKRCNKREEEEKKKRKWPSWTRQSVCCAFFHSSHAKRVQHCPQLGWLQQLKGNQDRAPLVPPPPTIKRRRALAGREGGRVGGLVVLARPGRPVSLDDDEDQAAAGSCWTGAALLVSVLGRQHVLGPSVGLQGRDGAHVLGKLRLPPH